MAFGALVIALCQLVRVMLEHLDRQTRQAQGIMTLTLTLTPTSTLTPTPTLTPTLTLTLTLNPNPNPKQAQGMNAMLKMTIKCLKCCLWCFEKTVRCTHYGYTHYGYTHYGCTHYGYTHYGCLCCFEKTVRFVTPRPLKIPHTPHRASHPHRTTHA
jgi:hypothetical protein